MFVNNIAEPRCSDNRVTSFVTRGGERDKGAKKRLEDRRRIRGGHEAQGQLQHVGVALNISE